MKSVLLLLIALVVAVPSLAFSQDAAMKEKMGDKGTAMKSVTCDPACGFAVRGHDEAELISMVQMHAKKHHNVDISEADVRKMMKEEKMEQKEMEMEIKKETKEGE